MTQVSIKVHNLDALRANFKRSPAITLKYLARATSAAIMEVEKQAVDRNFQFKTPRSRRTGQLANSFSFGRYISPDGLRASIGPTVKYAPYVYFGTGRIRSNRYMDRIARAAESDVGRHFTKAVDRIAETLAKT